MLEITMMMTINIILSAMFLLMNHPLSMGMILLLQTLMIALITGNMTMNFWYSYILFLVMVGGMLILFMYMTSIASNEKFKLSIKILIPLIMIPMMPITKNWMTEMNSKSQDSEMIINPPNTLEPMMKFMQSNTSTILIFLMMYLFLALIATVKIININQGPLRQMN